MTRIKCGCILLCTLAGGVQLAGCSANSQLIGKWQAEPSTPGASGQITGFATTPTDGRIFKADNTETIVGTNLGGVTGTVNYTVSGDSLTEVAPGGQTWSETFDVTGSKLTITTTINNTDFSEVYDRVQ